MWHELLMMYRKVKKGEAPPPPDTKLTRNDVMFHALARDLTIYAVRRGMSLYLSPQRVAYWIDKGLPDTADPLIEQFLAEKVGSGVIDLDGGDA